MFDRWLKIPAHDHLHWIGLALIAIGLPLNPVVTSVGAIWVPSNWILEGKFRQKWEIGKKSWLMWLGASLFLLHVIGMLWTQDLAAGGNDLRIKLPLLALPVVLGTRPPLPRWQYFTVLKVFVGSVVLTSLINFIYFSVTRGAFGDVREMSLFIAHNRYSLMVVLAVMISLYFFLKKEMPRWILSIVILWLITYCLLSGVVSGILFLVILLAYSGFHVIVTLSNKRLRWAAIAFSSITVLVIVGTITWQVNHYFDAEGKQSSVMMDTTSRGNPYRHDPKSGLVENGHFVWRNISAEEISEEWAKRSDKPLDKQTVGCILRYLTSLGLPKDGDALASLPQEDIENIENGMASSVYARPGLKARLHEILYEWQDWYHYQNVNDHSLTMRLEFFTVGSIIALDNIWTGVGTGDLQTAFDDKYEEFGTKLAKDNRLRSHNQFLTMTIAFGIVGGVLFLLWVFYPLIRRRKNLEFLHIVFTILLVLSCLAEDTLETQAGATFVALFWSLLVFRPMGQETKVPMESSPESR